MKNFRVVLVGRGLTQISQCSDFVFCCFLARQAFFDGIGLGAVVVDTPAMQALRSEYEAVGKALTLATHSGVTECPPDLDARRRALAGQILRTYGQAMDYLGFPHSRSYVFGNN